MNTNSPKMSLEERLVQHIKETGLGALIDDEDAITELTRRAVREALLQPIRIAGDYGRYTEKDSPVVAAAREIAKEAVEKLVKAEVERLTGDAAAMKAIREAIVGYLPQAVKDAAQGVFRDLAYQSSDMTLERLRAAGLLDPNKFIPSSGVR